MSWEADQVTILLDMEGVYVGVLQLVAVNGPFGGRLARWADRKKFRRMLFGYASCMG